MTISQSTTDRLGVVSSLLYSYVQSFWKVNHVIITPATWEFQFFLFLWGFNEESRIESTHIVIIHSYQYRIKKKNKPKIVLYFSKEKQLSNSAQKGTCLGLELSKDLTGGSWEKFCVMLGQDQCYCLSQRSIYFQYSVLLMAPHERSSAAMPSWKWFRKMKGYAEESHNFLHRMHSSTPQRHGLGVPSAYNLRTSFLLPAMSKI